MRLSFLTPRQVLLTPDGRFETVEAGGALAPGRPDVWLARPMCAHQFFDPGAARGGAAWAAARLHARSTAPFVSAGALVERSGGGFSIWWWDLDRVEPALVEQFGERAPATAPELFLPPTGGGWRVLRSGDGFEAQFWGHGGLIGSLWRRTPFDRADWQAFTRVQPGAADAPADPPAAVVGLRAPFPRQSAGGPALSPHQLLRAAPAAATLLLLTAAAFWLGQGPQAPVPDPRTGPHRRRGTAVGAADAPGADTAARRLAAFSALSGRPNLVAALSVATRILRLYGVGIEAVDAQDDRMDLTLPYSALNGVDRIARDMEASGVFTDVRPITNASDRTIRLRMRLTGRPDPAQAALNPDG
jgi:hypothetical protein